MTWLDVTAMGLGYAILACWAGCLLALVGAAVYRALVRWLDVRRGLRELIGPSHRPTVWEVR